MVVCSAIMRNAYLTLVLTAMITPLYSATIVLPNGFGSTVANDDSGPLSGSFTGSFINQHIWDTSQFGSVGGSLLITQIAYRMKPGTGSINATTRFSAPGRYRISFKFKGDGTFVDSRITLFVDVTR